MKKELTAKLLRDVTLRPANTLMKAGTVFHVKYQRNKDTIVESRGSWYCFYNKDLEFYEQEYNGV